MLRVASTVLIEVTSLVNSNDPKDAIKQHERKLTRAFAGIEEDNMDIKFLDFLDDDIVNMDDMDYEQGTTQVHQ